MNKFGYTVTQSFRQIRRNKGMTLASVFAITAMLLILGLFSIVVVNVNIATDSVKDDYNTIEVFYPDKAKVADIKAEGETVKGWSNVEKVNFRSKEDALKIMKERWGDSGYLLESLDDNPLPNSLVITVEDIEKADAVAVKAEKIKGIEDIKYYKNTVDKLVKFSRGVQIAGMVIIIFLIFVSIIVVANTIKLTVINRSDEISIMKYVGATNWFIRGPFMMEGVIIGALSAIVAAGITTLIYSRVVAAIGSGVAEVLQVPVFPVARMGLALLGVFLILGVIIGALGSTISMRRFLNV